MTVQNLRDRSSATKPGPDPRSSSELDCEEVPGSAFAGLLALEKGMGRNTSSSASCPAGLNRKGRLCASGVGRRALGERLPGDVAICSAELRRGVWRQAPRPPFQLLHRSSPHGQGVRARSHRLMGMIRGADQAVGLRALLTVGYGKYISKDTWYGRDDKPFQSQVHYFAGCPTKMYSAAQRCPGQAVPGHAGAARYQRPWAVTVITTLPPAASRASISGARPGGQRAGRVSAGLPAAHGPGQNRHSPDRPGGPVQSRSAGVMGQVSKRRRKAASPRPGPSSPSSGSSPEAARSAASRRHHAVDPADSSSYSRCHSSADTSTTDW